MPDSFHAPLQMLKGWLFVSISAGLIFFLIRRESSRAESLINDLELSQSELNAQHNKSTSMLAALPIAIAEVDFSKAKRYLDQQLQSYEGTIEDWFHVSSDHVRPVLDLIEIKSLDGAACELFKVDSTDTLISDFSRTFTHNTIENLIIDIICHYQGDTSVKRETEFRRFDGSVFDASTYTALAKGAEKSWERVVVVIEDISEKVAATNAVNSFFDLGVNLHIIAGLDGTIYRVNQGWETSLGYKASELEGKLFLDFVHPDDIEKTLNEMSSLGEGDTTFFFENRYRDRDGKYRSLTWSAISPGDSQVIYAVATDATNERLAVENLHQAASIIENTSEGIMVTDLRGVIQDVNPAFTTITGYEPSEVIGAKASKLSSGKHDRIFYQRMWQSLQKDGKWQGEIWNRSRQGEIYPEYLTINGLIDNQGEPKGYVGVFSDISMTKENEDTIARLSSQDALTGLPNARVFADRLLHSIDQNSRKDSQLCVLSLDIDNFKLINESLGFNVGDELLVTISERLKNSVRTEDTISRFGGDEFKLLIEGVKNPSDIKQVINQLQKAFINPFEQDGQLIHLTACIGVSFYPSDGKSFDVLIRNADTALSQAKQLGSSQYQFYSKELTEAALENIFIENALRLAIEREQLFLLYQPQLDLNTKQLIGIEALIRWNHPDIGVVSPTKFISIAERTGMIQEIGEWVLEEAFKQGKMWLEKGYDFGHMAINVSASQLANSNLDKVVDDLLKQTQFDPKKLELEVTESFIMQDADEAVNTLNNLRAFGIQIAIDDFGTGYSSLSYLKNLPIDKLKIDQTFVSEITENEDGSAIIDAIISLGKAVHLTLIAEGVETKAQEAELLAMGCDQVQGFLYDKPLRVDALESLYLTKH